MTCVSSLLVVVLLMMGVDPVVVVFVVVGGVVAFKRMEGRVVASWRSNDLSSVLLILMVDI